MTKTAYLQSRRSRLGEVALWATAAMLTLTVHAGAAYYLLQEPEEPAGDSAPPAAIMIELAALPEAVQTEDTVEANDQVEQQEVMSNVTEPVEEPVPEEPQPEPEPVPEPVVEEPPPTPEPPPEPPQETAEPNPEELPPEPVQETDPVEQQQMAALENVEVPLPVIRPPPPPVEKKVEKEKEPEKKKTQAEKPKQAPQRAEQRDIAKAETTQSNRTAAPRNSGGLFSSSMTPAKWESRIRSQISRKKPRNLNANGMVVTVSFRVSESGALSSIRLRGSTGDASVDQQVVSWIERASPVTAPPPNAARDITLPIKID